MQFTVKIENADELISRFRQAPDIVSPILTQALSAAGAVLAKNTVKGVVPWKTGFLTQSFRAELTGFVLRWFPTASYAAAVEFGHKQEVGRFVPAIGKRLVKPFVAGNPYMERIVDRAQPEINEQFVNAVEKITAAMAD
jgi:hypothetical protein